MAKVFIGVGHGGNDPGAVSGNLREKDLNLVTALEVYNVLHRHNVTVQMSRTNDENEKLNDKIAECNKFNPDVALDIHYNAGGGDGAECYHHYKGGKGKTLAENVLAEMVKIGQNSRGAKIKKNIWGKDFYAFIRDTVCPAIIVECAFLDNKTDMQIADSEKEQRAIGVAIAKAILKSLNILYIEEKKEETSGKLYRVQVGAYSVKKNAEDMKKKLKDAGFEAIIVEGE